ncbi:hypothetical protein LPJ66_005551 [Kickxella alabastrina]|uniref:Uncharacterized protein n=1 Tax=Kickxella alabastrina TaxID=61397 RepID=A0ACC1II08_9FUNG|nr:hypothetical protein LPJ66_005551 [Kickxella alabastrina]
MEKQIIRLYQERIDKYDEIFSEALCDIDHLKTSQRQITELRWDNNKLTAEVAELREELEDLRNSLINERQSHLEAVAENDQLLIREHELKHRVRVLAGISEMYYKQQDAAVTNSEFENTGHKDANDTAAKSHSYKQQRPLGVAHDEDDMTKNEFDYKQLQIENETLQMTIETMRIQLQEQKNNYAGISEGISNDFKAYRDVAAKEAADKTRKIEELETELDRIKGLYRENLRDLIIARKAALESKHSVKHDSLLLRSEIVTLQRRLDAEMERSRFLHNSSASLSKYDM